MKKFNIAIDGPAGAGKSTIARMVAKELGFVYVDTGAMYRAVTWKVLQSGVSPEDEKQIARMAECTDIDLKPGADRQLVFVDGIDVTDEIRTTEINKLVSEVARIPEVRTSLVHKQKRLAIHKGIVMDGRDIGTQVLPDAELKIFLTASVRKRAERRLLEINDPDMTLEKLEQDIAERDKMDRERETSPLVRAKDAVLIDSTCMTLHEVVGEVLELCRTKVTGGK